MIREMILQETVNGKVSAPAALQLSMFGEITSDNAHDIYHKLRGQLDDADNIKVSLSGVEKIDLAGFNVLIRIYMTAKRLKKELTYVDCHDKRLAHLITLTRFHHVFHTE
ncbi:STAS domain-containing protein [Fulvivirga sp. M361]|uniref:STAS domain-containing protein n=1 Tax=Fulvivirga sp. M361 TaxID=2594266 RepID=UPI00162A8058|nr:STAS domain-containing protein [Fulvivirga sp. M361]